MRAAGTPDGAGSLPARAARGGGGPSTATSLQVPRFNVLMGRTAELEPLPMKDDEGGGRVAFVAVDLLRGDGPTLLALPLLERKRLLDSLIRQGALGRA